MSVAPVTLPLPAGRDASAHRMLHEICVSDMRLSADIGVYAHEKGRKQALIVDVTVVVEPGDADELRATLDYNAIAGHAEELAGEHIALIETFARRLAMLCLSHPMALCADITVRKPGALSNGIAAVRVRVDRCDPRR
jgi:7,8-dihydroneopterin aldolase/epimerase/oxygenase